MTSFTISDMTFSHFTVTTSLAANQLCSRYAHTSHLLMCSSLHFFTTYPHEGNLSSSLTIASPLCPDPRPSLLPSDVIFAVQGVSLSCCTVSVSLSVLAELRPQTDCQKFGLVRVREAEEAVAMLSPHTALLHCTALYTTNYCTCIVRSGRISSVYIVGGLWVVGHTFV